jgi:AcrR family transcriptional regulator
VRLSRRLVAEPAPDTEKPSTKLLLIEVGEELFARRGIDGVSIREITAAAGQANSTVVQYHFKSKAGLVSAILQHRLRQIEAIRRQRFEQMRAADRKDARALLRLLWSSQVEATAEAGRYFFGKFSLQYQLHSDSAPHPIFGSIAPDGKVPSNRSAAAKEFPATIAIVNLLREACAALPDEIFNRRVRLLGMMFMSAVSEIEQKNMGLKRGQPAELDLDSIMDLAAVALSAPVRAR